MAEGLQDLYFIERKMAERASYSAAPKPDDYSSRLLRAAMSDNSACHDVHYGLAERGSNSPGYALKEGSAIGYASGSGSYLSQNTAQKTFCCGRKNAGEHMRCGGCPER